MHNQYTPNTIKVKVVQKLEDRLQGASRDLTSYFMQTKQRIRAMSQPEDFDPQRERFKPKTDIMLQMHQINQRDRISSTTDIDSNQFGSSRVNGNNFMHKELKEEVDARQNLPPLWIDISDNIDENITAIAMLID